MQFFVYVLKKIYECKKRERTSIKLRKHKNKNEYRGKKSFKITVRQEKKNIHSVFVITMKIEQAFKKYVNKLEKKTFKNTPFNFF